MHGYSLRLLRIRAIVEVRTARNTAFVFAFVGFTITLIRLYIYTDQKFARMQEVPEMATLEGYKIGLK